MTYHPTPDDRSSIVIRKQGTYRGATRVWSNRYHFEGDTPADSVAWTTLADNIVAAEKTVYTSDVTIVEAIGYDHSTATLTNLHGDAVFTKTYSTVGTYVPGAGPEACPGDCAAIVRWSTPARSVRNHPVYLMNYFHNVFRSSSDPDSVASSQVTLLDAYAAAWQTGFTDGTGARERCGPHGAVAIGHRVDPFVRHRDFPA